jgi:hypothetical protein
MKEKEMTYDRVIALMKNNPPVPENGERLTAGIMAKIDGISGEKRTGKRLLLSGWVLTVAATCLICLLVSEVFFLPDNRRTGTTVFTHTTAAVSVDRPVQTGQLPAGEIQHLAPAEKYGLLHALIKDRREARMNRMQIRMDVLLRTSD